MLLMLRLLLLLLLLLLQHSVSGLQHQAGSDNQRCRLRQLPDGPVAACSLNSSSCVDLSGSGLTGWLTLTFENDGAIGRNQRGRVLRLAQLNLAGNPGLTGVTIAGELASFRIGRLDISGTAMAPLPGRLLNATTAQLLSIDTLVANASTSHPEPLDVGLAAEYLYRLHVQTFALIGWPLARASLPPGLTSHATNRCGSKAFSSLTVSRSRLLRAVSGADFSVTDAIDLSANLLRSVSNVTFSAAQVDLSDNQLLDLPGVAFRPGSICRAVVTGPPVVHLRRNRLRYAALDSLAAGSWPRGFAGLDLGGNPSLLPEPADWTGAPLAAAPQPSIPLSDFLDLSNLDGQPTELAALLARFRLSNWRSEVGGVGGAGGNGGFRLSLAGNRIPDLASAARLVAGFGASDNGTRVHLDLSGNPIMHLNLTDLPPQFLASVTLGGLPRLRLASVSLRDADPEALAQLQRDGHRLDASVLAGLWSASVPLHLPDSRPDRCCLVGDASDELVCVYGGVGAFCYSEDAPFDLRPPPSQSAELPMLFTGAVLGCAILLGFGTGVGIFYARRRGHGRYAVYSIHAVQRKEQQQQARSQLVQLRSITVSSVLHAGDTESSSPSSV